MELETQGQEFESDDVVQEETSLEDVILQSVTELEESGQNEEPKADKPISGDANKQAQEPEESELKKAARTLANAKKGKKTVEASELKPEPSKEKPEKQENVAPTEPVDKLLPPQRWPLESKEAFNKLPDVAKKEVIDFWQGIEGNTTKLWQDLNREKQRYTEVNHIVDHYMPKWGVKGLTPQAAVTEMFAMQDQIISDPLNAYSLMLSKSGITPEQLIEHRDGGNNVVQVPQQNITNQQNNFLTKDDLFRTMEEIERAKREQAEVDSAASEIRALQQEVGPDGRYIYPELQPENITRVQPLVDSIMKTQQGVSFTEATKRAVQTIRLLDGTASSPSQTASRLPTPNQSENINKIKAASVSVSGRGAASKPQFGEADENESLEDSIRRTVYGLTKNY